MDLDKKDLMIGGVVVAGLAAVVLFMRGKGGQGTTNAAQLSGGTAEIQGGFPTASTVYIPTKSYDIHYLTNNGTITTTNNQGKTTTVTSPAGGGSPHNPQTQSWVTQPYSKFDKAKEAHFTSQVTVYNAQGQKVGTYALGHNTKIYGKRGNYLDIGQHKYVQAQNVKYGDYHPTTAETLLSKPKAGTVTSNVALRTSSGGIVKQLHKGQDLKVYGTKGNLVDVGMHRWIPKSDVTY